MSMQIVIASSLLVVGLLEPDIVHQMRTLQLLVLAAFAACDTRRKDMFMRP